MTARTKTYRGTEEDQRLDDEESFWSLFLLTKLFFLPGKAALTLLCRRRQERNVAIVRRPCRDYRANLAEFLANSSEPMHCCRRYRACRSSTKQTAGWSSWCRHSFVWLPDFGRLRRDGDEGRTGPPEFQSRACHTVESGKRSHVSVKFTVAWCI